MRAEFRMGYATFYREPCDKRYHGMAGAKGEHALFHAIAKFLNQRGFSVIKKRAAKDGHLVDDIQPYIRTAQKGGKPVRNVPHIYIISGFYALRGANEDWNKGSVELYVTSDVFGTGQDTSQMIRDLCEKYPDMKCVKGNENDRD